MTKTIPFFEALIAADLITQKVGMSVDVQEGYKLYAMYAALQHRVPLTAVFR